MNVRLIAHACIEIEHEGSLLLTDPWFHGKIFNHSWCLTEEPDPGSLDLARVRHIVISHEHPDHLNFSTLRTIRERVSGPLTVYYRLQENKNVRDALVKSGFEVVELAPHHEHVVSPGLTVASFPTRQDAAQVIRAGDRVILNQNDCRLFPPEVAALKRMYPRIDLWLFQFSLAGYYANADDQPGLSRARAGHLELIGEYYAQFRPGIFVPYASFVRFCKEANAFMNRWAVGLDEVIEAFPDLPIQILRPGDAVLWRDWEARNEENLRRWSEVFAREFKEDPHERVEEGEILKAANKLLQEARAREFFPFRPAETHLQISETGHALAIDFRNAQAALLGSPDNEKLAGVLPAEELLYFLKHPWGADTLNITACFHVTNAQRWRRMLRLRQALYTGTVKDTYLKQGRAWLLGRLARGAVNRARALLAENRG